MPITDKSLPGKPIDKELQSEKSDIQPPEVKIAPPEIICNNVPATVSSVDQIGISSIDLDISKAVEKGISGAKKEGPPQDVDKVIIIIIIIITVLITHYAKPQCVYKYEYRQLYITITIIYYKYVHVCNRYKIKQYSICNYSISKMKFAKMVKQKASAVNVRMRKLLPKKKYTTLVRKKSLAKYKKVCIILCIWLLQITISAFSNFQNVTMNSVVRFVTRVGLFRDYL